MSRTDIVKCKTSKEKLEIYNQYKRGDHQNKKNLSVANGISTRTLGRIINELEGNLSEYDYSMTKDSIIVYKDSDSRVFNKDHPWFRKIHSIIVDGGFSDKSLKEAYDSMSTTDIINRITEGNITFYPDSGDAVYANHFKIENTLSDILFHKFIYGGDLIGFMRFMDKLMDNPEKDIIEHLYRFLRGNGLDIDKDGDIISYKGVSHDYKDKRTGKIDNSVGESPSMPRSEIVLDPKNGCGRGLHSGSLSYATDWAGYRGHVVIVKTNPRDVCSIPFSCNSQKMRQCKYKVIAEYNK